MRHILNSETLLLAALRHGPATALELSARIKKHTGLSISSGMLYIKLPTFKEDKLVESYAVPTTGSRVVLKFMLTSKGFAESVRVLKDLTSLFGDGKNAQKKDAGEKKKSGGKKKRTAKPRAAAKAKTKARVAKAKTKTPKTEVAPKKANSSEPTSKVPSLFGGAPSSE